MFANVAEMAVAILPGIGLALAMDIPLAARWGLGVRRASLFVGAAGGVAGLLVSLLPGFRSQGPIVSAAGVVVTTNMIVGAFLLWRFYRDPERTSPAGDDVVVSPADGKVLYVRETRNGFLPVSTKNGRKYTLEELAKTTLHKGEAVAVGIGMTFLDVHVNRAPIAGRVCFQRHFSGWFGSLRQPEMIFRNERRTTVIERENVQVAVVQIASRLVRQIVSFVREGQAVGLGERIGAIRFGSQVDLILPLRPEVKVTVKPGARVWAGESVIAVIQGEARAARGPAV